MSSLVSGMPGGQPSTTQPIAGPWLSPQVVTRNRWPKVLWDMDLRADLALVPVPGTHIAHGTAGAQRGRRGCLAGWITEGSQTSRLWVGRLSSTLQARV